MTVSLTAWINADDARSQEEVRDHVEEKIGEIRGVRDVEVDLSP